VAATSDLEMFDLVFDLVIFDLDGTLVDSLPDIAAALNLTLSEQGVPPLPVTQVATYVGDGAATLVRRALSDRPQLPAAMVDGLVARFRQTYAENLHRETRPYPGIDALLRALSSSIPLAVVTNKPNELARPLLAGLGLERYFADVIGDGDGFARKPAPDAGRWLLARHGAAADRALVIGDGLPDVRFARALGCRVAAATWGYSTRERLAAEQPDWLVDTADELLSLFTPAP
jgi:phosphoglycolate phosphatase